MLFNIYIDSWKSGIESMFMKFIDDTELQETPSVLEGRIRIQNIMGELEKWNWIQVQIEDKLCLQLTEN